MRTVPTEISKPENAADFELMCTDVYGVVFNDPTPKRNGRSGQKQAGVDIFIHATIGRIGIQCKRYQDGKLKIKHVEEEINRADLANSPIVRLIVATTAANDANLLSQVLTLSDKRVADGRYPVEVEFWGEISAHINRYPILQDSYAPTSPGAAYYRAEIGHTALMQVAVKTDSNQSKQLDLLENINAAISQLRASTDTIPPPARTDSVNKFITLQLDQISELLKKTRYRDAFERLAEYGIDLTDFDAHQKARWYVQRGVARIHLQNPIGASEDFTAAYQIYPRDEKIAASYIRSFIFGNKLAEGILVGTKLLETFPSSVHVWIALSQARLIAGGDVTVADLPSELIHEPEMLQLLCWAACQKKDFSIAVHYGREILALPDYDFYGRSAALVAALSLALADSVARNSDIISASILLDLEAAVQTFEPRTQKLWSNQSEFTLMGDASNLAYAYIVLSKPETALRILDEFVGESVPSQFVSIRLEALRDLDRNSEFLEYAKNNVEQILPQALLMVAETVASIGDIEFFETLASLASLKIPKSNDEISSLRWVALHCSGDSVAAVNAVTASGLDLELEPILLLTGIRVLLECKADEIAVPLLDRAIALITNDASPEAHLYLANLLYKAGRYAEAATIFEAHYINAPHSILGLKLLRSYNRAGQRGKARKLLEAFPAGWEDDDAVRREGIYLAQLANDWLRLLPLATVEIKRFPAYAPAWMLFIQVQVRKLTSSDFIALLKTIPTALDGDNRDIATIAGLEIRYGETERGMLRLYRLYRRNLEDADVASYFMTAIAMAQATLPWMDTSLPEIIEGSSFCLEDQQGNKHYLVIDPAAVEDLPKNAKFLNLDDPQCTQYLGKKVGDSIVLEHNLGTKQRFRVTSISTAFRRLLQLTHDRAASAFDGLPNVTSIQVVREDGGLDLSEVHRIQKQRSERVNFVFEAYASNSMTLGICADALGTTVIQLVLGWPTKGNAIKVTSGDRKEQESALEILRADNTSCVIDLATLTELVLIKGESALRAFRKVYVSTASQQGLFAAIEKAKSEKVMGTTAEVDGQFRIIEYTEQHAKRHLELLDRIEHCINSYCEVAPSYGAQDLPEEGFKLEPLLGDDEYQALLLAHEKKLPLLSLDQNLRAIGNVTFGVQGVWPQALLVHSVNIGLLTKMEFYNSVGFLFLSNRNYTSIDGDNLAWLMMQGEVELYATVKVMQRVFTSDLSEFWSVADALDRCLYVLIFSGLEFESFLRFVEIFYKMLFIHSSCPDHFLSVAQKRISVLVLHFFPVSPISQIEVHNLQLREVALDLLRKSVLLAKENVLQREADMAVGITVLKITKFPMFFAIS